MQKKGQVTLFLIIGIVLLAGVVTVNVFKTDEDESRIEIKVPQEMTPIKNYISGCIAQVGEEAIRKIGKSGGYIGTSSSDNKYTKATFKMMDSLEPTESDGITFNKGLDWKIPYWQYFASKNDCMDKCVCGSKQPDLLRTETSIQKQIERYLDEKLKSCIDFDDINGFDSIKGESFKTKAYIGEEDVRIILDYRIDAEKDGQKFSASNFDATIPVRLKNIYTLADSLTRNEKTYTYLEKQAMTVVSSFTSLDPSKLPPISESELDPRGIGTMWIKSNVKNQIEELLSIYIPTLSVADTANFKPRYDRYSLFILPNNHSDDAMSVSFTYLPDWQIYFNLKGRGVNGELIRAESMGSSVFDFIGLKKYTYYYDFSHPVLVRIHDKESFDGKGFDFYFALESNVRTNKEMSCAGPPRTLPPSGLASSLLCKRNQACANATMKIIDTYSGKEINDASITYSCGETTCEPEPTDLFNQSSHEYGFPQCMNGKLEVSKEGYFTTSKKASYICGNEYSEQIEITPFVELNVSLKKKKLVKIMSPKTGTKVGFQLSVLSLNPMTAVPGSVKIEETETDNSYWMLQNISANLIPTEEAAIVLEKIKENSAEEDFMATAMLSGHTTDTIKLLPGKYNVNIVIVYKFPDAFGKQALIIPAKRVHQDGDLITDDMGYEMPTVIFNETIIAGQLMMNNDTMILEIKEEDLKGKKNVTFYAPGISSFDQFTHEDLEIFGSFAIITQSQKDLFNPVFS